MLRRTVTLAAALLAACSRPQPSPDYERARALWTEVVRASPAAPADDPRSEEVLALLERVPRDSLDAQAAAELRDRVAAERRATGDERARREELVARAGVPAPLPGGSGGPGEAARQVAPPPAAAGLRIEELRAAHPGCIEARGTADVTVDRAASDGGGAAAPARAAADGGPARRGELWAVRDDAACRERLPELAGRTLVVLEGVVVGMAQAPRAPAAPPPRPTERREAVELVRLEDGGVGLVRDGGVVPVPAGARVVLPDGGMP